MQTELQKLLSDYEAALNRGDLEQADELAALLWERHASLLTAKEFEKASDLELEILRPRK